jgi:hypothetical protein
MMQRQRPRTKVRRREAEPQPELEPTEPPPPQRAKEEDGLEKEADVETARLLADAVLDDAAWDDIVGRLRVDDGAAAAAAAPATAPAAVPLDAVRGIGTDVVPAPARTETAADTHAEAQTARSAYPSLPQFSLAPVELPPTPVVATAPATTMAPTLAPVPAPVEVCLCLPACLCVCVCVCVCIGGW